MQQPVHGKDYRLVVLDREIISAYERIPLYVVGDGTSSILRLLKAKQRRFAAAARDTRVRIGDPRIAEKLQREGMTLRSVPPRGTRVSLLDNANLSAGGDAVDVTENVHPEFSRRALQLTRDMGLRLCGVDLMIDSNISEAPAPEKYWVLEINAAPGLDHYVKIGRAQKKIVENLYVKVLRSLDR